MSRIGLSGELPLPDFGDRNLWGLLPVLLEPMSVKESLRTLVASNPKATPRAAWRRRLMLRECFPWVGKPALGGFRRRRNQSSIRAPSRFDSHVNRSAAPWETVNRRVPPYCFLLPPVKLSGAFHNLPSHVAPSEKSTQRRLRLQATRSSTSIRIRFVESDKRDEGYTSINADQYGPIFGRE